MCCTRKKCSCSEELQLKIKLGLLLGIGEQAWWFRSVAALSAQVRPENNNNVWNFSIPLLVDIAYTTFLCVPHTHLMSCLIPFFAMFGNETTPSLLALTFPNPWYLFGTVFIAVYENPRRWGVLAIPGVMRSSTGCLGCICQVSAPGVLIWPIYSGRCGGKCM